MATRTARAAAQEKAAETKRRSRRPAVEVRHVQPQRPERSSFPAGVEGTKQYREAETAYETALLAYAAESGAPAEGQGDFAAIEAFFNRADSKPVASVVPVLDAAVAEASGVPAEEPKPKPRRTRSEANRAEVKAAEKKQPAKKTLAKSTAKAPSVPVPDGFKSWTDPKLATAVVRMKTKEGKTVKEIASALGLPAVHRSWFLVSKVWRDTADAKGIDRPRLSEDAIAARKAKRETA